MYWLLRPYIWLSRIAHCRGFGVQSPTDYRFVRYVINESWSYYAYAHLGKSDDALTRKIGLLCFRIANWRQPHNIVSKHYLEYLREGCKRSHILLECEKIELMIMSLNDVDDQSILQIYNKVDNDSVIIVEDIQRHKDLWIEIVNSEYTRVTYDLYYCGIVLFDKTKSKNHYIINF